MSKVLIVGSSGNMGKALCYAMNKLGHEVCKADSLCDSNEIIQFDAKNKKDIQKVLLDHKMPIDLVISALPYYHNFMIAREAIIENIPYFDLGGHVETSHKIKNMASEKDSLVLTDLGLAPGWINILAEQSFRQLDNKADSIEMAVGGIPIDKSSGGPLNYIPNWSISGLLNEYRDNCEILRNGEIITVKGMSGLSSLIIDKYKLEAFYTSGGASHTLKTMQQKGVLNCNYKTLRWPGHNELINWLLKSNLSDKNLEKLINTYFTTGTSTGSAIQEGHQQRKKDNQVILYCQAKRKELSWTYKKIVLDDNFDEEISFTAMQKCTAFPCASAVQTIIEKSEALSGRNVLNYSDIDYEIFNNSLKRIDKSFF